MYGKGGPRGQDPFFLPANDFLLGYFRLHVFSPGPPFAGKLPFQGNFYPLQGWTHPFPNSVHKNESLNMNDQWMMDQ